jgi:hypothetical protein
MREHDPERLQNWIRRAATPSAIDDVLDEA